MGSPHGSPFHPPAGLAAGFAAWGSPLSSPCGSLLGSLYGLAAELASRAIRALYAEEEPRWLHSYRALQHCAQIIIINQWSPLTVTVPEEPKAVWRKGKRRSRRAVERNAVG